MFYMEVLAPQYLFPLITLILGLVEYLLFLYLIKKSKEDLKLLEHKRGFIRKKIKVYVVGLYQSLVFIFIISPLLFFSLHPNFII